MMYRPTELNRLTNNLQKLIEKHLEASGVFYRIFSRVKLNKSLEKKINQLDPFGNAKYDGNDKRLRDLIGIRINLYFVDDQQILLKFLKQKLNEYFLEETVDVPTNTEFKPTRVNLVFRLPQEFQQEFRSVIQDVRIDATFELQLRTIISEGWHEVDHDFRYKCPKDWDQHNDLSRTFNGMLAALETHEWGMLKLFEELSYSHYKAANYGAMIRMHLRIRTEDYDIGVDLTKAMQEEGTFIKDFFRLERAILIDFLLSHTLFLPFTLNNLIYLVNYFFIRNDRILEETPEILKAEFKKVDVDFEEVI
jgi:putative GTP pyrophosphokinase